MGCTNSKLDDLPAVALCRDRCGFLNEAIRHRFLFAESHVAYTRSLKRVGHSLHHFIEQDLNGGVVEHHHHPHALSPKHDTNKRHVAGPQATTGGGGAVHSHSHSHSGSHLHFHTSDEDDDDGDDEDVGSDISHLHHHHFEEDDEDGVSPLHAPSNYHLPPYEADYNQFQSPNPNPNRDFFTGGGVFYMKNKASASSVVYEQKPVSQQTVYFGEASSSSSQPPFTGGGGGFPYYGYQNNGGGGGGGGYYGPVGGPYYGGPSPPRFQQQAVAASSSKPPPPPPPPPQAFDLDFLDLFNGYEKYYPQYTPSRDSKELREEEGIPDLEDEVDSNYQHEVVKEVHGHKKYIDPSKSVVMDDGGKEEEEVRSEASFYHPRPNVSGENDRGVEYEVHVVDKKVVDDEERRGSAGGGNAGFKAGSRDVFEVAVELKVQFDRASDFGNEIAHLLEAGKLHYQRKHISKMLQAATPSFSLVSTQPSTSKSTEASSPSAEKAGPALLEMDEELSLRFKTLSATLHKLYLWEKKLYNEVKAEEKMRVVHDRKCRKLKRLDDKGAEAHKLDGTQMIIRSLSTKIRMAIQVVDRTSVTINKIRDEELWPQLNDLIQGLTRMWKSMLECHHNQYQAIREARGLSHIGSTKKLSDGHLEAALELEHELLNWTSSFSGWIGAQKGYVRALNNWLVKCLLYEPEETADGIVPFSPGRMGAPMVFVICNQWAQAMDRISEKEVIEAMRTFATSVLQIWEQDRNEMHQRLMINKDLERKVRNLDREDQKIQKQIQALDKKLVLVSGDGHNLSLSGNVVHQSDVSHSSLQASLQHIFETMERFMSDSMKAYEELIQRGEEERHARQHDRVP